MGRKRRIPRGGFVPRAMEYTQVATDGTLTMKSRMDGPSSPLATFTLGVLDNPSREEIGRHGAVELGTRRLGSAFLILRFPTIHAARRTMHHAKTLRVRAGFADIDRHADRSATTWLWLQSDCPDLLREVIAHSWATEVIEGTMPDPSSGTSQHLRDTHVYRKPRSRAKLGTSPRPERSAEMKAWQDWQRTGTPHVCRGNKPDDGSCTVDGMGPRPRTTVLTHDGKERNL